jgi:ABC-type transport system substrate-binding protein
MDTLAAKLINNELDSSLDLLTPVIANVVKSNPKITTYSGHAPPYGNFDWWPNSLWVNTQLAPYSDVRVRHALSLAIDRDRLDKDIYERAPIATIYPFPLYPGLQKFVNSPDVKVLEAKYQPRKFDLDRSAQLMTAAGFSLNADGLWASDGQTLDATINGFAGIHATLGPVLVAMLRRAGFDASANFGNDAYDQMNNGRSGLYLFGHGASLTDPYAAFEMFHSRYSLPIGTPAIGSRFSRYSNPAYDQIVDAMAVLSSDDPKFHALAVQALEIYWRDTIDIPIVQWLHRIPYNQTYWTNWPTEDNLALGTNGAFWHATAMLVIASLKPAQ